MATTVPTNTPNPVFTAGLEPVLRVAAWLSLGHALLWAFLLFRWVTFGSFGWSAFAFEEALATLPGVVPYALYVGGMVLDAIVGMLLLRGSERGRVVGIGRNILIIAISLIRIWII